MVVPMAPIRAKLPVVELLAPMLVASLPDWEVERQIGDDPRNNVDSYNPEQPDVMDKGSHQAMLSLEDKSVGGNPLQRHQWEISNQFSSLNNLGREGDPWSEEVEEVLTAVPCVSDKEGCDFQTVSEVAYVDGMQNCESELLFLPWGQSGINNTDLGNGENGPLECAPLSCWVPRVAKDMVLRTVAEEGELDASKVEHLKWVSTMMNSFCKMVGFLL